MAEKTPQKPRTLRAQKKTPRKPENNTKPYHAPAKHPEDLEQKLEAQCRAHPGQPTKAELKELTLIEYLARRGHSMWHMHEEVNKLREENGQDTISYQSFLKLRERFPEYFGPIKTWMEEADKDVRAALYASARGAEVWEEKALVVSELCGDGYSSARVEIVKVKKKVPPNASSIQFWLANRLPEEFKRRVEDLGDDLKKLRKMSDAELGAIMKQLIENPDAKVDFPPEAPETDKEASVEHERKQSGDPD
jgi:hypothetical protein